LSSHLHGWQPPGLACAFDCGMGRRNKVHY
jgi:hypothetical protein